jgi:hypothetical protein
MTARSVGARLQGRRLAHFIHVGKTGGTALKQAVADNRERGRYELVMHTHGVRMIDLPRGDTFFFVVRDPVDRFVSGFNSRLRQGAPAHHVPWSAAEARAFATFDSPAALGLALGRDGDERARAVEAMTSIEHVRRSYWYWFASPDALRRRARDILWIGFLEHLDTDVVELARRLGLSGLALPHDDRRAHRSTDASARELPPAARDALADWYRRDYEFVALCRELADTASRP